ncbi:hypothetical protein RCZ04_20380 [Capnocytophaga sp. HP1101]
MDTLKRFERCLILSGGGTRFALYGGMYQALTEIDKTPSLLIATCGGAFAALVINAFSTYSERKAYLQSEEFYYFIKSLSLTPYSKLHSIGLLALQKRYDSRRAPYIEDVYQRYLVNMPQELDTLLPSIAQVRFSPTLPTIIVGAKMLFTPEDCNTLRGKRKLYQKVLFTDAQTADIINVNTIQITSENYRQSAVDKNIMLHTAMSMLTAARISVSDMYYVAPVNLGSNTYAGGAIDLVPIELATALSREVIREEKQPYTSTEEALVRAVLGFSGNERLVELTQYPAKCIDTRNATTALKGFYSEKYIDWKRWRIGIHFPKDYAHYRKQIERQWDYGYQTTINAFKQ